MIDVEDLVSLVRNYNPNTDADFIRRAYAFGMEMHDGQFRRSGEPYFTHPVAVAAILTEQRLDDASIVTALLHDTVEDTRASYKQVEELFGHDVAELVDGVTKLTNLQLSSSETKQAENFRKLFIAMSKDMRVILVKLADRLHNMRTIKAMRAEKQIQKARETMDIFAPLAGRMGMQWMREELEDLSFRVINPDARNSIMRRFVTLQRETGDVVHKITNDIRSELDNASIRASVYGRAKKPYSIWRKMEEKKISFSRLCDIYGFRIIVENEQDCYKVLGLVHQRWKTVPGRFKDYISQPKSNGYRSIHTTISGRDSRRVEIQIRTQEMHDVAESGVAAHWSYRDGERSQNPFAVAPAKWLSDITERFKNADDHGEFLEHVKLEMYTDKVFTFTPKGEVISLPRGATPLDFAYAIHTRIGNSCVGAKVDGMRVPLWTRLRNGQSVIIINAEGQKPQSSWLGLVATGKAKAAIRKSLREEDRERFMRLGRELVRVAFDHIDKKATDKALETAAKQLSLGSADDLLSRVGSADLNASDVLHALYPELMRNRDEIEPQRAIISPDKKQKHKRAECCQPVPGERIVGITYEGQGVIAHAIDCSVLSAFADEGHRWVDLHWHAGPHAAEYVVSLDVTIANDAGILGRICTLIGEHNANISDLTFPERKEDFYRVMIDVELRDREHLHAVMLALEADSNVARIKRHRESARAPQDGV